jgi:phosphoglycerate dehydrogenase-like enzyme
VPHTPETANYIDRRRLALMKRGSFFINIGRGPTVVLDDLVDALRSDHLGGAGLDVFDTEPLPADHPLWHLDRVTITPHAGVVGPYLQERRVELVVDNARLFAAGEPLRNQVDKSKWY